MISHFEIETDQRTVCDVQCEGAGGQEFVHVTTDTSEHTGGEIQIFERKPTVLSVDLYAVSG